MTWHARKFVLCSSCAGGKLIVCSTFTKSLPAPQEILEPFWRPENYAPMPNRGFKGRGQSFRSRIFGRGFARHPFLDALPSSEHVLSLPGMATALVFFLFATNTERYYSPTRPPRRHPPCVSLSTYAEMRGFAFLYPRMLNVGLRISIHVCWNAWVCVSLSTYAERGFAYLYPRMLNVGLRISIHVCWTWVCVSLSTYPKRVGLRISIHVCWSAWVCVSLSTYPKRVGLRISIHVCWSAWVCVFDDDMMMLTWCVSRLAWRPKKTKCVKK